MQSFLGYRSELYDIPKLKQFSPILQSISLILNSLIDVQLIEDKFDRFNFVFRLFDG
jgi:hypothetical protein